MYVNRLCHWKLKKNKIKHGNKNKNGDLRKTIPFGTKFNKIKKKFKLTFYIINPYGSQVLNILPRTGREYQNRGAKTAETAKTTKKLQKKVEKMVFRVTALVDSGVAQECQRLANEHQQLLPVSFFVGSAKFIFGPS
jgi:hypothetical protein